MVILSTQYACPASPDIKIRLAFIATALVDALGGPAEFHARFSFPPVTSMIPNANFSLPPGVWTDDTSMALCIAKSIATHGFDEGSQLYHYYRWWKDGELSAVDECFDIGNTTSQALGIYSTIIDKDIDAILGTISQSLKGESFSGNGSLMRLLPVPLAFWESDKALILEYARRSSLTTHPSPLCIEACQLWSDLISLIMKNTCHKDQPPLTKFDLLLHITRYPYSHSQLKEALSFPQFPESGTSESSYGKYHPILRLAIATATQSSTVPSIPPLPSVKDLPSSGFVLHSLVAALYAFFSTETFEKGAILCVNLGDDADTVGAIYGGLGAVWYGSVEDDSAEDLFWNPNVQQWRKDLVRVDLIAAVADEVVKVSQSQQEL